MLQYDRLDVLEGIDINKSNKSKECIFAIIDILKILDINLKYTFVMIF